MEGWWRAFDISPTRWPDPPDDPAVAWSGCGDPPLILRSLSLCGAHRQPLIASAAACARTSLHRIPPPDRERAERAIAAAEAWASDRGTGRAAHAAALAVDWDFTRVDPASRAAGSASEAARAAAIAADTWLSHNLALDSAVSRAAAFAAEADEATGRAEVLAHRRALADLVRAQTYPLTVPSATELRRAPQAIAVAWDRVTDQVEPDATLSTVQALCSFTTAIAIGFDPDDPLGANGMTLRAIAERLQLAPALVPEVSSLLGR